MTKTTTIGLPLPNKRNPQRVIVTDKNRTKIYYLKNRWHSTTKKVPKNAKYSFDAKQLIGKSQKAQKIRDRLRDEVRDVNIARGRPKGSKGRKPYGGVTPRPKTYKMTAEQKQAYYFAQKALIKAFDPKTVKRIEKIYTRIIIKQIEGKELTSYEKKFLEKH